ncbi:hypothetical protein BDV24DRAFT_131880 [Aspergillus arachidicola]|uniref:Uncharacterized protein n=1 Tax=Aspergillus arachidicola TaxID=656916 RepID=A0A5N6Y889_9EURO|nr:hypothetical protein BDV24DRAFT_131880 [Aspergillus arachidicola]
MISQSKSLSKTRVLFLMSQVVVIPHSRLSFGLAFWLGSGAPVILAVITLGTSFPVDSVVMSSEILLGLEPLCSGTACYITLVRAIVNGSLVFIE